MVIRNIFAATMLLFRQNLPFFKNVFLMFMSLIELEIGLLGGIVLFARNFIFKESTMELLIALVFCVFALFIGCDQGMRQPIMAIAIPPQDSLEKARAAMKRVNERRLEAYRRAEKTGDFSPIFIASEDLFKEELGFRKGLWVNLVEIYRQENLEDATFLKGFSRLQNAFAEKLEDSTLGMFYFQYISAFDEIIIEYLHLSFEFPEKNEEELLALFRDSVRDRKTFITFP